LKVLVVGGGIAGLNCALRLLKVGCQVTVAEKQKGFIDKVCGEGVLPFGMALLDELGLAERVRSNGHSFYGISYFNGSQKVCGKFPEGSHGVGVDRVALDKLLREACSQYKGFNLMEGVHIKEKDTESFDRVLVADGIHSAWARSMGRKMQTGKRLGIRFRIATPPPQEVQVHFFPHCEVYFTPTGPNTLSVAFLIDAPKFNVKGSGWKTWLREFFAQHFPQLAEAPMRDMSTRAPIVSKPLGNPPNIHLLGDALQAFDPICGAGMSFALLCGKLAAQHIHDPAAYYKALEPAMKSVGGFTNTILFFRGGGFKTWLMMRQLGKSPNTFNRILSLHDGKHRFTDLGLSGMLSFLRP